MTRGVYTQFRCKEKSRKTFNPTPHQQYVLDYFPNSPYKGLLLYHKLGCLAPETPILTWNGEIKRADEIKVGDKLVGDDGTIRTVLELVEGVDNMYNIVPSRGDSYTVNSEHVLSLKVSDTSLLKKTNLVIDEDDCIDIKVSDYINLPSEVKGCLRGYKCKRVYWGNKMVKINPYILGKWLGDSDNYSINKRNIIPSFNRNLKQYNLSNTDHEDNKHIPSDYLINDVETRLSLLAGIIDSVGYIDKNCVKIYEHNRTFANDIRFLVRSLGFYCKLSTRNEDHDSFVITISGNGIEDIPVRLGKLQCDNDNQLLSNIIVIPLDKRKYCGWRVDGNERFLLGDFTVTHNSGKTCTSVMIADKMLEDRQINRVFVITPGSLRKNWIEEYCKVCGIDPEFLRYYYTFITYNANVGEQIHNLNFNNSLVIIDETHNLINAVKNQSKNAWNIYTKIINSDCRVLALTGTPIFNATYEWSLYGNMLKPGSVKNIIIANRIYSEVWDDNKLTDSALQGVVSYYQGDPSMYPTVHYHDPIKIPMNPEQYFVYEGKDYAEKRTRGKGPPREELRITNPESYWEEHASYMLAVKYITSRRWSNFYYPREMFAEDLENGEVKYKEFKPDKLAKNGGWIDDEALSDKKLLTVYSPKFTALIVNILREFDTKHMVYTFYKERAGVQLLKALLTKCGIPSMIFSGDLSDTERASILRRFNSVTNRNGENIKVLLVTEAGGEGITIMETNNVHILESSTREKKVQQAIGRVVRYKSHINMPKDRQYVNVWRYWSTGPNGEMAVDEMLYIKGSASISETDNFMDRLVNNSIENV